MCYNVAKMKEAIHMKRFSAFKIVITALFAALICVATMIVRIPIAATGGYANLGDGVILLCAFLLHPLYAVIAAGLGSALADLLAGYAAYAPATLLIKAGAACVAALIYNRIGRKKRSGGGIAAMMISAVPAEIVMALGYFFYEAVILDMGAAAAVGILGNAIQGAVGVAAACLMAPMLLKSKEVTELMEKTRF